MSLHGRIWWAMVRFGGLRHGSYVEVWHRGVRNGTFLKIMVRIGRSGEVCIGQVWTGLARFGNVRYGVAVGV